MATISVTLIHARLPARDGERRVGVRSSATVATTIAAIAASAEPRSSAPPHAGMGRPSTVRRPKYPATSAPATVTHGRTMTSVTAPLRRRARTAAASAAGPTRIADVRCVISIQGFLYKNEVTGPEGRRAEAVQPGQLPHSNPDSVAQTIEPRATARKVNRVASWKIRRVTVGTFVGASGMAVVELTSSHDRTTRPPDSRPGPKAR